MATFGETLKRERELRKISLREISEATKIGLRYLEALEGNRFDQLPGGLFNKGFIRAYAKFIGLDGEGLVDAYLYDVEAQKNPQASRPAYAGLRIEEAVPLLPPPAKTAPRPNLRGVMMVGVALAVVLGAGALLMIFRGGRHENLQEVPPLRLTGKAQIGPPPPGNPAGSVPDVPGADAPASAADATPSPAPGGEAEGTVVAPPEMALTVSVSEPTWIAVSCDGIERLNREMPAGGTVALSCVQEIRLSAGNAGVTAVRVNGRECLPLGERGEEIRDLVFNAERVAELCPDPQQE